MNFKFKEGSLDQSRFDLPVGSQKTILFQTVLVMTIILLLAWYIRICRNYPFYFVWDMDHLSTIDTVLIQSGLLPDHMHHTSFGMYLALFFSQKIGALLGAVSILNLDDIAGALNPLGAIAELTDYFRLHSPFLAICIAVMLSLSLYVMFGMSRWYFLLFLTIIATQESLTFHSSMIRTEFYSVFYWSGALLAMGFAVKARSTAGQLGAFLSTGVLSGLSFLTKVQSLFYVASIPLLIFVLFSFSNSTEHHEADTAAPNRNDVYCLLAASLINIIVFSYLHFETYTGSGLSLLAKFKGLFFLASAPLPFIILLYIIRNFTYQDDAMVITRKRAYFMLGASLVNIFIFSLLSIFSYMVAIPWGIMIWAAGFSFTRMTVFFFSGLLVLILYQLSLILSNKYSSGAFRSCFILSIIAAGFLLSFGLHFFVYSDVSVSLNYLFVDFKMLFLRKVKFLELNPIYVYWSDFLKYSYYNPTLLLVNILLNILLICGYYFKFLRIHKRILTICLIVTFFSFLNIIIGTRFILRDILWKETLVNFLSLFYFSLIVSRAVRHRLVLTWIGSAMLVLLLLTNCIHSYKMPDRIDADVNHYGWMRDKWFSAVYSGNQPKYTDIMHKKYNRASSKIAKNKAAHHREIRRIVDFVFKNQNITHRNIGIAFTGFSAWTEDPNYKINQLPAQLVGSILVDNGQIPTFAKTSFKPQYVRGHSQYLDKMISIQSDKTVSVLTRNDLKIFLFATEADAAGLLNNEMVQSDYKISLQKKEQIIELHGLELKNYCQVPLEKIKGKFFFVIRQI